MPTIPAYIIQLLWLTLLLTACDKANENDVNTYIRGQTMGTYYSITIKNKPPSLSQASLSQSIDNILNNINARMSTYERDSELSKLNQNRQPVCIPISLDLFSIIEQSLKLSRLSEGAFDITIGPLVNLWGFGPEHSRENIPSAEAINLRLAQVGYQNISLDNKRRCLKKNHKDLYIDLSAIAKGYAIDRIADYLDSVKLDQYLIDIGGDLKARNKQTPWRIAIEKPSATVNRSAERIIHIRDKAVATSGNYRNYFSSQGQHYSHIINPSTGKPVNHHLVSVTVIEHSAAIADAYATLLMVLGPEQGLKFSQTHNIAAYFIVQENNEFQSLSTGKFEMFKPNQAE